MRFYEVFHFLFLVLQIVATGNRTSKPPRRRTSGIFREPKRSNLCESYYSLLFPRQTNNQQIRRSYGSIDEVRERAKQAFDAEYERGTYDGSVKSHFAGRPAKSGSGTPENGESSDYARPTATAENPTAQKYQTFTRRVNGEGFGGDVQLGSREVWFAHAGDSGRSAHNYADYFRNFEEKFPERAAQTRRQINSVEYPFSPFFRCLIRLIWKLIISEKNRHFPDILSLFFLCYLSALSLRFKFLSYQNVRFCEVFKTLGFARFSVFFFL